MLPIACPQCKRVFKPVRKEVRCCSVACANLFKTGKSNRSNKGSRTLSGNGYITIRDSTLRRAVPEHRILMERHLGRKLASTEIVHHIDENPLNNELSNLLLLPSRSAHKKLHASLPSGKFRRGPLRRVGKCLTCKRDFSEAKHCAHGLCDRCYLREKRAKAAKRILVSKYP